MDSVDPDLFIAEVTKVFGHFMKYAVDSFEPEEMVRYPLSLSIKVFLCTASVMSQANHAHAGL